MSYTFIGYATDPNRDALFYTFDWGDGQTTNTDLRTAGLSARASHAWPEAGVYSVRVKAKDSSAESPWSAAKRVTIKKDPSQRVSQLIEKLSQELSRKRADLLRSAKGLAEA